MPRWKDFYLTLHDSLPLLNFNCSSHRPTNCPEGYHGQTRLQTQRTKKAKEKHQKDAGHHYHRTSHDCSGNKDKGEEGTDRRGGVNQPAAYRELYHTGELKTRVKKAKAILAECCLCPRQCRVNRLAGESGKCQITKQVMVSSYGPHFGEEAPLVGTHGSGTIFFTFCNLRCIFCQNCSISQSGEGTTTTRDEIAGMMLSLQARGCHNINLVSPTHVVPYILDALELAAGMGLHLPLVYNTGGYDSLETLELLDGIVDIYMPDMKYSDEETAEQLSGIEDYPKVNRAAIKEMHRQVGDLQINEQGVAQRGLLIRHLVLPHRLAGTEEVVRFLAQEVSTDTYLNIMAQYRPCHRAANAASINRPLLREEFREAIVLARQQGLHRLDKDYFPLPLRFILR